MLAKITFAEVDPLSSPPLPRAPGEPGLLGVAPWGVYANLLHNDSFTHSDKLLTQSSRVGFIGRKNLAESYNLDLAWRVVTPSFKSRFGAKPHDEIIGCFADLLEVTYGKARTWDLGAFMVQVSVYLGVSHYGDKGARLLQVAIHKLIDTSTEHLTFADQPRGYYSSGGAEAGVIFPSAGIGDEASLYGGAGTRLSEIMNEIFVRILYVQPLAKESFRAAAELKVARQLSSRFLGAAKALRWEYALGLVVYDRYMPTINYVSDYLKGDDVGQVYIDLLNFSIEL